MNRGALQVALRLGAVGLCAVAAIVAVKAWSAQHAPAAQDEAQLVNARLDLARFQSLSRQDFASRQQVDTQQATVNQLVAAIAGDSAAIEAAQLNVGYCFITSPVDGRVGLRLVDPGNLI